MSTINDCSDEQIAEDLHTSREDLFHACNLSVGSSCGQYLFVCLEAYTRNCIRDYHRQAEKLKDKHLDE